MMYLSNCMAYLMKSGDYWMFESVTNVCVNESLELNDRIYPSETCVPPSSIMEKIEINNTRFQTEKTRRWKVDRILYESGSMAIAGLFGGWSDAGVQDAQLKYAPELGEL